jgi:hypothetical protein
VDCTVFPALTRALHKSGSQLYVEMTFGIVKGDAEGCVLGSVAMARDVTERVEGERAADPRVVRGFAFRSCVTRRGNDSL